MVFVFFVQMAEIQLHVQMTTDESDLSNLKRIRKNFGKEERSRQATVENFNGLTTGW